MMRTPVGDHSPAVRSELNPSRTITNLRDVLAMTTRFIVRDNRRGPEPCVIIESGRNRLHGAAAASLVDADTDLNPRHISDGTGLNGLTDGLELSPAALLRSDLKNGSALLGEIGKETAFGDRLGEGLLQPHRLVGEDGCRRDESMPKIRHADHYRVDVFASDKLLVVAIASDLGAIVVSLFDHRLRIGGANIVKIAHRDDAGDVFAAQNAGNLKRSGDASASNHADVDLVVGGKALSAAAENQRSRACGKHPAQETAPVHRIVHNHFSL